MDLPQNVSRQWYWTYWIVCWFSWLVGWLVGWFGWFGWLVGCLFVWLVCLFILTLCWQPPGLPELFILEITPATCFNLGDDITFTQDICNNIAISGQFVINPQPDLRPFLGAFPYNHRHLGWPSNLSTAHRQLVAPCHHRTCGRTNGPKSRWSNITQPAVVPNLDVENGLVSCLFMAFLKLMSMLLLVVVVVVVILLLFGCWS